jgi:hypothetical protein
MLKYTYRLSAATHSGNGCGAHAETWNSPSCRCTEDSHPPVLGYNEILELPPCAAIILPVTGTLLCCVTAHSAITRAGLTLRPSMLLLEPHVCMAKMGSLYFGFEYAYALGKACTKLAYVGHARSARLNKRVREQRLEDFVWVIQHKF